MKDTRDALSDEYILQNGPFKMSHPTQWHYPMVVDKDGWAMDRYICRVKCQERVDELNNRMALLYMVQGTPAADLV